MNLFAHLSPDHLFFLIRRQLENEARLPHVKILLEACLRFGILYPGSVMRQIRPLSETAVQRLADLLQTLKAVPAHAKNSWVERQALEQSADEILDSSISILYVDGGYRSQKRSAWAVYDVKRDAIFSGRSEADSSSDAEWLALLQGCRYASLLDDQLVLLHTDCLSLVEQIDLVFAQASKNWHFAWKRYHNEKLLQIFGYMSEFPLDIIWRQRQTPGICRVDQACNQLF